MCVQDNNCTSSCTRWRLHTVSSIPPCLSHSSTSARLPARYPHSCSCPAWDQAPPLSRCSHWLLPGQPRRRLHPRLQRCARPPACSCQPVPTAPGWMGQTCWRACGCPRAAHCSILAPPQRASFHLHACRRPLWYCPAAMPWRPAPVPALTPAAPSAHSPCHQPQRPGMQHQRQRQ